MTIEARQLIAAQGIDHAVRRVEAVMEGIENNPRSTPTTIQHVERLLEAVRAEVARQTGAN